MTEPGAAPVYEYDNVAGNAYDKYNTTNPIARALMKGFFGAFHSLVDQADPKTSFEVGCGEGYLSADLLARGVDARGCDLEAEAVDEANALASRAGFGERFAARSVYDIAPGEISADLIVCCEVMEHLPDPDAALAILAGQDAREFIFSVPREPLWRAMNLARGKYISRLGNTPGHIQHWGRDGFCALVARHFDVQTVRSPLPWTMLRARKPH
jgi:2-polyprenyl-3-methyl-5-hydroxy-6-metoxy-1,4-benzoquinol methylase